MQVEKLKMERESEETSGSAGPTAAGSGSARHEQQEDKETRGSDGETTAPGSDGRKLEGEETRAKRPRPGATDEVKRHAGALYVTAKRLRPGPGVLDRATWRRWAGLVAT